MAAGNANTAKIPPLYVRLARLCMHRDIANRISAFDPFTYSKGRWLDRDQAKRNARNLRFDFDALVDKAVKCCPGARRVLGCEKKEGGFNRVFMFRLDSDETVAARLPMRHAGPPGLTTSSEVATLRFGIFPIRVVRRRWAFC